MLGDKSSSVYLARCVDTSGNTYLKVGKANDPIKRLANLQVGCPFQVSGLTFFKLKNADQAFLAERKIHRGLKAYWLRGEWFYAAAGDAKAMADFDCLPVELASVVAERPIIVQTLDLAAYEKSRKRYQALFRGY